MQLIEIGCWSSLLALFYVYFGYHAILQVVNSSREILLIRKRTDSNTTLPCVSVVITVHNEERNIERRISNLLSLDYPKEKLEILVASDGSSDRTTAIAGRFNHVRVLNFTRQRGRAATQNDAVATSSGEIVVFTDAETDFEPDFLAKLARPFADHRVGCVIGNLIYRQPGSAIAAAEGLYFRWEKRLRELESDLGVLATGTGACMAVRSGLWRVLSPIDDCDFSTPLDVVLQGYAVKYAPDAVAYDFPAASEKAEFRTRVRQTSKNLIGTLRRWGFRGWFTHPLISCALLSHKLMRWFTPFLMIVTLACNLLVLREGTIYPVLLAAQGIFYGAALIGMIGNGIGRRIPVASFVASFCVANVGMGIGVIRGLAGKAPAHYRSLNATGVPTPSVSE